MRKPYAVAVHLPWKLEPHRVRVLAVSPADARRVAARQEKDTDISAMLEKGVVRESPHTDCTRCGIWVCAGCDWRRTPANRNYPAPSCARCHGHRGRWLPIRHRDPLKHTEALA
jgi:hypothetical protein